MITQIKLNQEVQDVTDANSKQRPALKAALRLAEKEEMELIEKIAKFHDSSVVRPIVNYDQEKTLLQKCLDIPSSERNKKMLKKIKAELTYLKCFQAHSQEENMPKQVEAIMKRDLDMLTAVISKFVHGKVYPKASIIETVATDRKKVRILLRGEVAVFEPINYKSFKNCMKHLESQKVGDIMKEALVTASQLDVHFDSEEIKCNNVIEKINPEELELTEWQDLQNSARKLSLQTAKNLLRKVNLISMTTPHRLSRHLQKEGELIASDIHPYIVDQPSLYEHTAICLNQCYVLELEYEVYKQAIAHLNSDQQKKYIETLLRKFETMDYFDAKQYVRKQFMINKQKEEQQQKLKDKQVLPQIDEIKLSYHAHEGTAIKELNSEDQEEYETRFNKKRKQKQQTLQTFEIKYENDLYLIVEGEVTLQIDIIEETRLSSLKYASKIRQRHPRAILKLYQGDLFGFQEIGKTSEYNLRYIINKDSKLLLMSEDIYVQHYYQIAGFKSTIKAIQKTRNKLIADILGKIQTTIEKQQLKKYQSLANIQRHTPYTQQQQTKLDRTSSLLSSNLLPPRQLQYLGKKDFAKEESKLRSNLIRQKEGVHKGTNLREILEENTNLNELLAFTSVHRINLPENCQIVGDFIEVRDSNGTLLRRRSISKKGKGTTVNQKQSTLLRRIGVIDQKQKIDHNLKVVKNRKSNHNIDDFDQQKRQFARLRKMAQSLPKLGYLYAKKEQRLYKNMNKLNYEKVYY